MRFLVDECTGPAVARWLRDQSHEVFSVYEGARGGPGDAGEAGGYESLGGAWRRNTATMSSTGTTNS